MVSTKIRALFASDLSLAKLDKLLCAVCGSVHKVEIHHLRGMMDIDHSKESKQKNKKKGYIRLSNGPAKRY